MFKIKYINLANDTAWLIPLLIEEGWPKDGVVVDNGDILARILKVFLPTTTPPVGHPSSIRRGMPCGVSTSVQYELILNI